MFCYACLNIVSAPSYFHSNHVLDEAERSLHDALCVLTQTVKETRTVPGGGCTEIAMAAAIDAKVMAILCFIEERSVRTPDVGLRRTIRLAILVNYILCSSCAQERRQSGCTRSR